jgi:site-specific DNA-methyltransferase (adenine-specific)/modification methylase
MIKLYHDDCRNQLKKFNENQFKLTITSPPYNMNLRIRGDKYCSRQIVKELSTKYVGYDDNLTQEEYFFFNLEVLTQLIRVSDLVFYNVQFLTGNKRALFKIIGTFADYLKEIIIWDKVNAEPAIGEGTLNSRWETWLIFSKDHAISRQFKTANFQRGTLDNIWQIKRQRSKLKNHGATFPEEMIEKIVLNFSKRGDWILDPFMGTGTVPAVCKRLKRNCIGVELIEDYYNYSLDRVDE